MAPGHGEENARAGVERTERAGKIAKRDANRADVAKRSEVQGTRESIEGGVELIEDHSVFSRQGDQTVDRDQIQDADGKQPRMTLGMVRVAWEDSAPSAVTLSNPARVINPKTSEY